MVQRGVSNVGKRGVFSLMEDSAVIIPGSNTLLCKTHFITEKSSFNWMILRQRSPTTFLRSTDVNKV